MRRHVRLTAALVATIATLTVAGAASADASTKRAAKTTATTATGVTASGGRLLLNGKPTVMNGVNAFNATTYWNVNWGCGTQISNLDTLFNSIPSRSLVRTWAFQALGYNNKTTHAIDFTAIDRVVNAAKAHGDYLIFTLSDQAGNCDDGHWHDEAWYDGGYTSTYNDDGRGLSLSMSYLSWIKAVVNRYASNPTVAVYEPVNEPESSNCNAGYHGSGCYGHNTCPSGATSSLRSFFDKVGGVIKGLDPRALVSTGTLGSNQCGVAGTGFSTINASSNVDIATFHDYGSPTVALPSGVSSRASQANALGKVFLVEESGINGSTTGLGCPNLSDRASEFRAKLSAAQSVGSDGYLPWNWSAASSTTCGYGIAPGDPLMSSL